MCGVEMEKKIDLIFEKLDAVPDVIHLEFQNGLRMFGIDPGDCSAMQELMVWARNKKKADEETARTMRNSLADWSVKAVVVLVTLGFITFYAQSVVKYAVREEHNNISVVEEGGHDS